MYHSITIGDKNTWDDWHLIPTSRPIIPPREVKTETVEIPGMNGIIDLTEVLTGDPVFGPSQAKFDFIVVNGYGDWVARYNELVNFLHGKRKRFWLEDEPGIYYEGRFSVSWTSSRDFSSVSMSVVIDVYRDVEEPEE